MPYGPTDPLNPDTDGDGVQDGTEVGETAGTDDTDTAIFVPDADPTTTTDPNDDDTDDDCLLDGSEDTNGNGAVDSNETDPNNVDTDADGIQDGTEQGLSGPEGDDTGDGVCVPDADPTTTTDPLNPDTDDDGLDDGDEDKDGNGRIDQGETDPNNPDTDGDGLDDGVEIEIGTDPTTPLEVQGSGGCDGGCAQGGNAPGSFLFALAGILAMRRRAGLAAASIAAIAATSTTDAHAQSDEPPSLDVQRFDPNPQMRTFTLVRDGAQQLQGSFGGMISINYGYRPFEVGQSGSQAREVGIVDHMVGFDLGFEVAATDWLSVAVNLPFLQVLDYAENGQLIAGALGGSGETIGIGDTTLAIGFAPLRQVSGHAVSFSIVPRIVFPTGSRGAFAGSGSFGIGGDVALARRWKHFRFSAMLGYQANTSSAAVANIYADDELRYGLGLGVPIGDGTWEVGTEFAGGAVVVPDGQDVLGANWNSLTHAPMEMLLAASYQPADKPVYVRFGIGPGLTKGFGTPDVRAFVQVGVAKITQPVYDADGDGIVDDQDACPEEPEDFDQFEDADGCPDPDNDQDGIPDTEDACPMDAEDLDRFEDTDGCPDNDNDNDGIPDTIDGSRTPGGKLRYTKGLPGFGICMNSPEDMDGFEDADGCPDADNDNDGIPDVSDGERTEDGRVVWAEGYEGFGNCMNAAEVVNGVDDDDGCPDEALAMIDTEKKEIVILDKVYFDYNRASIKPGSFPVLQAVHQILMAYPSITTIEVQGHTDTRGSDRYNKSLSQRRVDSVRTWLIDKGIEAGRLSAMGYGEEQPVVVDAQTEEDHARNRRVQFKILTQEGDEIEVIDADDLDAEDNE